MVKSSNELNAKLQELKPKLEEKYHVEKIGYFGSFVRGEQDEGSDVDILVKLEKPLGLDFLDLKFYLEDELERDVDLATEQSLHSELKKDILDEVHYL